MNAMSEDAKAILLLCGHFGGASDFDPLSQQEYTQIVKCLLEKKMRPSDLLQPDNVCSVAAASALPEQRLTGLLKRGVKLGFAVEQWNRSGIWVICRSDIEYPARYRNHLKGKAPPILYGAGDKSLLQGGGLAIVGSRNVDAEGESFTRDVAEWCARGKFPVVSGGARGVDQIAMSSALQSGGTVIGVLADSLLRTSVTRDARHALSDGRLLLISPYYPEAGFSVGTAMGRNKLIYALADYGLVVSADFKKGGTWEGAQEELRRKPGRPVFVRMTGSVPKGNKELVKLGAIRFPALCASSDPDSLLKQTSAGQPQQEQAVELSLFDTPFASGTLATAVREPPVPLDKPAVAPPSIVQETVSIYDAVLPVLLTALQKPSAVADLAKRLDVSKPQLNAWLKKALADKKVRKTGRPVRYVKA
jgi:predicted Rossmann fold nucleotide-binding protein DprA/Smf involved in DNA uptake